jgi:integrating conjugative element membrane protein (TIGR03747 family)
MLHKELDYWNTDFKRSAIVKEPASFATRFADHFYQWCYQKTGIESGILWLAQPVSPEKESGFRHRIKNAYLKASDYILAAMTITQVFAVRLAVLILAFPAFILLSLLGLVDGLVQRDIRLWCGGRESSFIYHWAKKFVLPSLILPWIIYLAMPFSVHPNLVVLPFAVLFSLSIAVMASTFKKYL